MLACLPRQGKHFLMTNNIHGYNAESVLGSEFSKSFPRPFKYLITAAVYKGPTQQRTVAEIWKKS